MKKIASHALATATVMFVATSAAFALDAFIDTTRQGPTKPPRFQIAHKYKVKGSRSKGAEKFHTSVGQAFLSDRGISFQGDFEARNHERPTFPFLIYAPVGAGATSDSSLKAKFISQKMDPQDAMLDMGEFAFALQRLDDDIGGHSNAGFKKPAVSINGTIEVTSLKVTGKARERNGEWSGSFKFTAKGIVRSGENDGKTFKATIKAKLKNAPLKPQD